MRKIRTLLKLITLILELCVCWGVEGNIILSMWSVFIGCRPTLKIHKEKILAPPLLLDPWMSLVFWGIWVPLVEFQPALLDCMVLSNKISKRAVCSSDSHPVLSSAYKAFFIQKEECCITGLLCQRLSLAFGQNTMIIMYTIRSPLSRNSWFLSAKALSRVTSKKAVK